MLKTLLDKQHIQLEPLQRPRFLGFFILIWSVCANHYANRSSGFLLLNIYYFYLYPIQQWSGTDKIDWLFSFTFFICLSNSSCCLLFNKINDLHAPQERRFLGFFCVLSLITITEWLTKWLTVVRHSSLFLNLNWKNE